MRPSFSSSATHVTRRSARIRRPAGPGRVARGRRAQGLGKVYFVASDGKPYWCTGISVASANQNVVATSGSCASEGNGPTRERWVFVPGSTFLGGLSSVYVADGLFTHYDWTVYGDADREVAFAAVYEGVRLAGPSSLRGVGRLGSNAGAQAIAYDVPVGSTVQVRGHSTGWPPWPWLTLLLGGGRFDQTFAGAAPAVKGEELQGVRSSNPVATSIGSAWLSGYDLATRTGSLSGVTIGTIADAGGVAISISARFDGETKTVFDAAAAVPGGPIA